MKKQKKMKKNKGLYVHIPFCSHICAYCDFCKMIYNESLCNNYLKELEKELASLNIKDIASIYVGGGTPSSLSLQNLHLLLDILSKYVRQGIHYTFEANVESLSEDKIVLLHKYGVNRVSLGVQSFSDDLLKDMNRYHNENDVKIAIDLLHKHHIDDINIDLIYGLPNQSFSLLKNDVEKALSLDVTHISTYALMVNPNTLYGIKKVKEKDDDVLREEYDYICEKLEEKGFKRYEVSNFAKEGFCSFHNKLYWSNCQYYGCGLGASSYIGDVRYDNTKSLNKYLKGEYVASQELLSREDKLFYELMLGLRMSEGICIKELNEEYDIDFETKYKEKIAKLVSDNLLQIEKGYVKVTKSNLYILDYIEKILLY